MGQTIVDSHGNSLCKGAQPNLCVGTDVIYIDSAPNQYAFTDDLTWLGTTVKGYVPCKTTYTAEYKVHWRYRKASNIWSKHNTIGDTDLADTYFWNGKTPSNKAYFEFGKYKEIVAP